MVNRRVLAAGGSGLGALAVVGAFVGGYAIAHDHVVTRVVTRTVTVPPVTHTSVRVVIHTAKPSPVASSTAAASSAAVAEGDRVAFGCKVEQMGGGVEEYEVTGSGGAAYSGTVEVSFYDYAGSGDVFPPAYLTGVASAGSAANWHAVPSGDIGASAEPSGCVAQAGG